MLYARGSRLPGGTAVVMRVIERKVYFRVGNHIEYLEIESAPGAPAAASQPLVTMSSGDSIDDQIGNHQKSRQAGSKQHAGQHARTVQGGAHIADHERAGVARCMGCRCKMRLGKTGHGERAGEID